MASEMVRRVARALAYSAGARMAGPGQSVATRELGWKGDGESLDQYADLHWQEHEHSAVFAIAAMREPTKEIVSAHHIVPEDNDFYDRAAANWRNLIDTALA